MSESLEGIGALRLALEAGEVSALELVEAARTREDAVGTRVQALLHPRWEAARDEATASDQRRAAGDVRSALDGIPIVLKDNIVQREEPATCASKILEGYRSPFSATAVERLTEAGAIVVFARQHGRVRDGLVHRELGSRPQLQSLGPETRTRRLFRRIRRGGRQRNRSCRAR